MRRADRAVLIDPLLARLRDNEPDVKVIRVSGLDTGEHCVRTIAVAMALTLAGVR